MSIRILLADDHQIVREGLRGLLAKQMDIEVIGEAQDGRAAVELARESKPDVVVMDIGMPELNGIDATRRLLEVCPNVRVIALSMHSDRRYIAEMLGAGAAGYLLKDSAFEELAEAIRTVAEGRMFISRGVAGVVLDDYVQRLIGDHVAVAPQPARQLTPREREVLQLIAEGKSTKEAAAVLHLSVKTIESHRRQIMEKLGIYNVAGLIKFALREGLTSLDE